MFLFGRSSKSPQELVKGLKELLTLLEKGEKKYEKVRTEHEVGIERLKQDYGFFSRLQDCRRCDEMHKRD